MEQLKQYGVILLPICVHVKLVPEVKKTSERTVDDQTPIFNLEIREMRENNKR